MILPVIFGSLSFLGMEALAARPLWYLYVALFFFILSIISVLAGQKKFVLKNFLRETAILFLFFFAASAVLFYLESVFIRQILIIASAGVYAVRIARVESLENKNIINLLFCIFFAFLSSAALFGLDLFFAVPTVYLVGIAFVAGYLLSLEIGIDSGNDNTAIAVFGAAFWSEIFFIMLMFPNALYLGAAVLAIFSFLFSEIFYVKHFALHSRRRLAIFSLILLTILFLTAKWI